MTDEARMRELLAELLPDVLAQLVEDPDVVEPPYSEGPFAAARAMVAEILGAVSFFDNELVEKQNKVTRADLYRIMSDYIDQAISFDDDWVRDSRGSWDSAAQAFRTRAAELGRDLNTEVEVDTFGPSEQFSAGERLLNVLSLAMRRLEGRKRAWSEDYDTGVGDQPLTVAECIRLCFALFEWLEKSNIVPFDDGTAFTLVKDELYNQYTAMGDSIFGPINVPGGSVPWSWAGGQ